MEFDESTHTYTVAGQVIPSVTEIIKKAGLIDDKWFNEFARERGSAVHKAIEWHISGELDEESVDDICRPYLEAFKCFTRDCNLRIYRSECMVYSKIFGYAGKFDLYGRINRRRFIIDFKTGALQDCVGMQLRAYMQAARECGMRPQARAALQLRKDGSYKLVEYSDPEDFLVFIQALRGENNENA